ncbi:glycosyltransferase family 2 protein [Clostridium perfringens]|uniref:glycosyltransferase family 2 protein n=1 Tax=Clostridium perfringens TaxID=1502 RepID=UPI0018E468EC|nr:glycosyltransferase family 2 protein [Clostridium perfringens]MBI5997586.1 glycosyltransferase family 2 protein [Clostridium perfringens]
MNKFLTIFTPTYNRAYIIENLYKSLVLQKNKEFIWLIVDDGSSDNTEMLVKKWIDENKIEIRYIKQKNQGKHIAHNVGVENCETEFFFCVDSDDYLLENAVQDIFYDIKYTEFNDVAGIVSSRIDETGNVLGSEIKYKVKYSNHNELYEKYKLKGDTALIFKTKVLEKYKFPKIVGEKFIGEDYIYCQIDVNYKLYISPNKYYVCKYLDDGYTKNMFNLIKKNPKGYTLLKKKKLELSTSLKVKYKSAALYLVGGKLSGNKKIIKESPNKIITILSIPLAYLVYNVRYRR